MKNLLVLAFCLFGISCQISSKQKNLDYLSKYNIQWNTQSKNPSESMPLGGGDIGCNVWVENGDLLFYLSQSGTFDENNQMLKLGRVRVQLDPNPFENKDQFSQVLELEKGHILIHGEKEKQKVDMKLWVDVFNPVVHIETESSIPVEVKATYETWRTYDLIVPLGMRHGSFSLTSYPGEVVTHKDVIAFENNTVKWYHRNQDDKLLIDFCIDQQGLKDVKDQIPNTQKGRTFGGLLKGENMVPTGNSEGKYVSTNYKGWQLKTQSKVKKHAMQVVLHTKQTASINNWDKGLKTIVEKVDGNDAKQEKATKEWWRKYWERSYISINAEKADTSDEAWQVGRNYQLFRYMLGCNAYGDYPSKFNGSLFTVDPVFTRDRYDWTPDFRCWGGGSFTAQNQRLVYWPMLKAGDFDMMPSQFDYYKRILSAAEARTQVYWGHEGACFTEQLENFGLPFAGGWGFESGGRKRDAGTEFGVQTNKCVNHHYVNQLEFSLMILDYYQFSGIDITEYLPFIKSSLKFFDTHYQYRQMKRTGKALDENEKLVFYPSTAAEMYKIAKNPVDVISALKAVLPRMQQLPERYVSASEKAYYSSYLKRIPDIPFDEKEGHKVIKPAESWEYVANQEMPELYAVYPYGIYGLNKPGLDVAINTYWHGESKEKRKFVVCWSQVGIFAARMGLTDEAERLVKIKLADAPRRFPAFWGPGPDWIPDVDHGGSGMVNLQEMLMQTDGKEILLFPSWPRDWDVDFKMHAPHKTIVEAELKDGKVVNMKVTPSSREKDVQILIK